MMERFNFLKKGKEYLLWIIAVIFAGCSMSYLGNLIGGDSIFSQSAISIGLFALLAWILPMPYRRWKTIGDKKTLRRRILFDSVFSFLLALSFVMGYQLRMEGMTATGVSGKLFIVLVSAGCGIGFLPVADLWFGYLDQWKAGTVTKEAVVNAGKNCHGARTFLISWAIIFACWIPVFLAYYPAIMSYDFHRQHQEAMAGYLWFNTHHPLIHTALVRWFLLLGKALGSYQIGMAIFSILQMLILSAVMAYSCSMIRRLTEKKWILVLSVVVFAVLPIHSVMALSVTKDVLFSAFLLLFVVLMLEHRMCPKGTRKWLLLLAMAADGILVMMFRNNASYAFLVFMLFYIIWSNRERVVLLLLCVVILLGGHGAKTGVQTAMQAGSGSKLEMYSVFIQQFCRVGLYHWEHLTPEQDYIINRYVAWEFWEDYNPSISDSIKGSVGSYCFDKWKDHIPQMLMDWVKIGLAYPNEYIDAFLELTCGYWFLDDVSHAEVLGYGEDSNLGLMYTFNASTSERIPEGIESHSYFPWLLRMYQKLVNGNAYYKIPVLSNLFKPAFYCWALVLIMLSFIYLKQYRKLVLCMFPFTYFLTLLLGPVVQVRYIYPVILAIPLLLGWLFAQMGWEKKGQGEVIDCKEE